MEEIMDEVVTRVSGAQSSNSTVFCGQGQQTWLLSIAATCAVGLSGIVPLAIIPVEVAQKRSKIEGDSKVLKLLLSFAVGGLLGDVFLHLLPEAWNSLQRNPGPWAHLQMGCWILTGIFTFVVVEMMFAVDSHPQSSERDQLQYEKAKLTNGHHSNNNDSPCHLNGHANNIVKEESKIHITGYLNLLANAIDNFSHGLAVAASFIVGTKMGLITTAAILIHEIPHEFGDFAILLKSGFDRWDAAKAQISTAIIGVMGAVVALTSNSLEEVGSSTSWILPFTAGGFINIALVNILPDLMKESDPWESIKQIFCICGGIAVMGFVGLVAE